MGRSATLLALNFMEFTIKLIGAASPPSKFASNKTLLDRFTPYSK